jgi:hypothetical protein
VLSRAADCNPARREPQLDAAGRCNGGFLRPDALPAPRDLPPSDAAMR